MVRSVLAIAAGVAALTAISFGIEALADPLLKRSALSHSVAAQLFEFAYGGLSIVAGGHIAAWVARHAPLVHAAALGAVQSLLTVWAMAAMWGHAPAVNWIVALAMAFPASLLGGWLFARRTERRIVPSPAGPSI